MLAVWHSYYGLLGQRFSMLHQKWQALFEDCFQRQYALIHRLETNKLRNVAKFFAHLLHTDAIAWAVLSTIHLTEDATTSSSRIFIKILFQVGGAFAPAPEGVRLQGSTLNVVHCEGGYVRHHASAMGCVFHGLAG